MGDSFPQKAGQEGADGQAPTSATDSWLRLAVGGLLCLLVAAVFSYAGFSRGGWAWSIELLPLLIFLNLVGTRQLAARKRRASD